MRLLDRRAFVGFPAIELRPGITVVDFGLQIPDRVPDVPSEVLNPRNVWPDKAAYDAAAKRLARLFAKNFTRFEAQASPDVLAVAIKP